jgi:hypothetical protein
VAVTMLLESMSEPARVCLQRVSLERGMTAAGLGRLAAFYAFYTFYALARGFIFRNRAKIHQ